MTRRIFNNPQEWIQQFDTAAMTLAELLALISILINDILRRMKAEYYERRLEVIRQLAELAKQKSGAD